MHADKMEQWNEAKRGYHESDCDSAIGSSHLSAMKSEITEVIVLTSYYGSMFTE